MFKLIQQNKTNDRKLTETEAAFRKPEDNQTA